MIQQIRKRDGRLEAFDANKIANVMQKAIDATETEYVYPAELSQMKNDAVAELNARFVDEEGVVDLEDCQTAAQHTLMAHRLYDSAANFILHRAAHQKTRELKADVADFCTNLLSSALPALGETEQGDPCLALDVLKNQNASSQSGTVGTAIFQNSEAITKVWFLAFLDPEIKAMIQVSGGSRKFYAHDIGFPGCYCAGWSLKALIKEGLSGVKNKTTSAPAKHLQSLCNQMVNFLGIMQNEWAGAQAFSSFDTYLAAFVKADRMSYEDTKRCIESFIYGVNTPSRWGSQCPFTNVTLDWTCPPDMKDEKAIVGGKEMDFTYGECKAEMDMVNRAFLEVMIEGDAAGRGFQYPIPTYSITKDFDWSETENNKLLFEYAAKYGGPYFSNYINSDMNPSEVRSMCCRLRLDLRELARKNGGNFGAGENTGSIGVCTVNLPQLAYLAENEDAFFKALTDTMVGAKRFLEIKRKVFSEYFEKGAYPYTKRYLSDGFRNHFSTIGIVGMNEACLNANWLRKDLTQPESLKWAKKVLLFMRERLIEFQQETGHLYNLEATPAESTCYTLARGDKAQYPGIITSGTADAPYYTNSTHLPVGSTEDVFDALDKEDDLQTLYTSGTVFHAFLGERLSDWTTAMKLVKTIAENYRLPYFTLSPVYSVCEDHGYLPGEQKVCPHCGKPTEVYSRITGYYRPVNCWNAGKSEEYKERKAYAVEAKRIDVAANKTVISKAPASEMAEEAAEAPVTGSSTVIMIVRPDNCPKCKQAEALIKGKDVRVLPYEEGGEGEALAEKYGIFGAPALIINGEEVIKDFNKVLDYLKNLD